MELFLKLHPAAIAWLVDNNTYGVINITSNLIDNGHKIKEGLGSRVNSINKLFFEKRNFTEINCLLTVLQFIY